MNNTPLTQTLNSQVISCLSTSTSNDPRNIEEELPFLLTGSVDLICAVRQAAIEASKLPDSKGFVDLNKPQSPSIQESSLNGKVAFMSISGANCTLEELEAKLEKLSEAAKAVLVFDVQEFTTSLNINTFLGVAIERRFMKSALPEKVAIYFVAGTNTSSLTAGLRHRTHTISFNENGEVNPIPQKTSISSSAFCWSSDNVIPPTPVKPYKS